MILEPFPSMAVSIFGVTVKVVVALVWLAGMVTVLLVLSRVWV